jgi:hypothetical protein
MKSATVSAICGCPIQCNGSVITGMQHTKSLMFLGTYPETGQHRSMMKEGTTRESRILSKEGVKNNSGNRGEVAKIPLQFKACFREVHAIQADIQVAYCPLGSYPQVLEFRVDFREFWIDE